MSIRLRVSAAVVMAALVVMSVVGLIAQRNQAALIDMARRRELESYSRNLASLLELAANQAVAEAELIANTESVRKLFRSGVDAMSQPSPPGDQKTAASGYRRLLIEELGQTYEVQHTQFGVVQAQFHGTTT